MMNKQSTEIRRTTSVRASNLVGHSTTLIQGSTLNKTFLAVEMGNQISTLQIRTMVRTVPTTGPLQLQGISNEILNMQNMQDHSSIKIKYKNEMKGKPSITSFTRGPT